MSFILALHDTFIPSFKIFIVEPVHISDNILMILLITLSILLLSARCSSI